MYTYMRAYYWLNIKFYINPIRVSELITNTKSARKNIIYFNSLL